MKRIRKVLSLVLVGIISLTSFNISQAAEPRKNLKRLLGETRVQTAIEISKQAYIESENAILVGYNGEVDALTGSLLAREKDAPMFFVNMKEAKEVINRLEELKTKNVYILGGDKVFSPQMMDLFKKYNPQRIKGDSRYETAINLALSVSGKSEEVFLALGEGNYADALSIGPVSASLAKPLFLTGKTDLSPETQAAMENMEVKKVTIIGGYKAISSEIEDKINKMGIETSRIYGNSREETSIAVSRKFNDNPKALIMANGYKYADAVVGGYFAAKEGASLILTSKDNLQKNVLDHLVQSQSNIFILGGLASISSELAQDIIINLGIEVELDNLNIRELKYYPPNKLELFFDREVGYSEIESSIKYGNKTIPVLEASLNAKGDLANVFIDEKLSGMLKEGSYDITLKGIKNGPLVKNKVKFEKRIEKVNNEEELTEAIRDGGVKSIVLMKNIDLQDGLRIRRPLTLQGNNKTLKGDYREINFGDNHNDTKWRVPIKILSDDVTINNLTIKEGDYSNITCKDSKNIHLNNVTLRDGGYVGLNIYDSEVTVSKFATLQNSEGGVVIDYQDKISKFIVKGHHKYSGIRSKDLRPAVYYRVVGNEKAKPVMNRGNYKEHIEKDSIYDSKKYFYFDKGEYNLWLKNKW